MKTVNPGSTAVVTESGLPTGAAIGFQIVNAATGLAAVGRTETGVIERPTGSGNYVFNFIAPAEGDLYLLVIDWNGGVLAPETTRVVDLMVSSTVEPGSSGLGAVADYVKMNLGGETWRGLYGSAEFGPGEISRAIDLVKRRVMTAPPSTGDEATLHPVVLDYLGVCAALELVPAARDYWASMHISATTGSDPSESVTYANRADLVKELRLDLMRKLVAAQAGALPLIDQPILTLSSGGPAIDEYDDYKSTEDPRDFPDVRDFPGSPGTVDAFGFERQPRRSGVRI